MKTYTACKHTSHCVNSCDPVDPQAVHSIARSGKLTVQISSLLELQILLSKSFQSGVSVWRNDDVQWRIPLVGIRKGIQPHAGITLVSPSGLRDIWPSQMHLERRHKTDVNVDVWGVGEWNMEGLTVSQISAKYFLKVWWFFGNYSKGNYIVVVCIVACYMAVKRDKWRKRMHWHFSGLRWERLDGCVALK